MKTMDDNFKSIDFADLYGIKPGEKDFSGAIERAIEEGPKHFGEDFLSAICQTMERRREENRQQAAIQRGKGGTA